MIPDLAIYIGFLFLLVLVAELAEIADQIHEVKETLRRRERQLEH